MVVEAVTEVVDSAVVDVVTLDALVATDSSAFTTADAPLVAVEVADAISAEADARDVE